MDINIGDRMQPARVSLDCDNGHAIGRTLLAMFAYFTNDFIDFWSTPTEYTLETNETIYSLVIIILWLIFLLRTFRVTGKSSSHRPSHEFQIWNFFMCRDAVRARWCFASIISAMKLFMLKFMSQNERRNLRPGGVLWTRICWDFPESVSKLENRWKLSLLLLWESYFKRGTYLFAYTARSVPESLGLIVQFYFVIE